MPAVEPADRRASAQGRARRIGLIHLILLALVAEYGLMWVLDSAVPVSAPYWLRAGLDALGMALILGLVAPFILLRRDHQLQIVERAVGVAGDGLWLVDHEGTLVYVNDAYCAMSGYRRSELEGKRVADVERLQSPAEVQANIAFIEKQGWHRFHTQHTRKGGEALKMCVTVVLDKQTQLLTVILRDETETTRVEGERDAALGELQSTFELAAVGLAHVSLDGRMVRVNRHFCDLLQYSAEELTALRFQDFTYPADLDRDLQHVADLLAGTRTHYQMEKRYVRKDGTMLWVSLAVALVRDARGQPERFISVVMDITHRKRSETDNAEAEAARRANQAKTRFLGRMSHELRTPLNAVVGFTQLLRMNDKHNLLPQQVEQLGHVQTAAQHMLELIDEALDINQIESEDLQLELQPLPLCGLVSEARALVEESAKSAGVSLIEEKAAGIGDAHAMVDRRRLLQALLNLLSNAIKYNRPAGTVVLAAAVEPQVLSIQVRDTGPGLSADQLDHLFEPFNRLGSERSGVKGTGLGLVITRRLVQAMGGQLSVASTPGVGSTFTVLLPRVQAPPPDVTAGA